MPSDGRTALVLPSVMASGTERRLAFVYRHLQRRYPGEYLLVVSPEIFRILNRGGFGLDRLPGVHVLGRRFPLDRKQGAHASPLVNLGRVFTLLRYRRELRALIQSEAIGLIHPYLELVPALSLFPLPEVPWIVPIVDHLPKYFDGHSVDCRLLLRAISLSERVDCLFAWVAEQLRRLGVDPRKLNYPAWNCVNHDAFHPEAKSPLVTFAARVIDWKNPMMMVSVVDHVLRRRPGVRFAILGRGKMAQDLPRAVSRRGWEDQVQIGYLEDPSPTVNRSLVHVSLDRYDNFSNQSLLEGMAAGCAVVASDVGETHRVVTEDVGLLAPLDPGAIAEAILSLLQNPPRMEQMGRAARARVMENHNVDRYIDYLRLVHDMSKAGPVAGGVLQDSARRP